MLNCENTVVFVHQTTCLRPFASFFRPVCVFFPSFSRSLHFLDIFGKIDDNRRGFLRD